MNERRHKSPDELEQEIRATESDIARTLDLIQHKVSPGAVVDAIVRTSRENGAEFAANFGRSVRDNPMPIALIGAGLAWLMISHRSEERDHEKVIDYSPHPRPHIDSPSAREDANRIYREGARPATAESSENYTAARDRAREAVRTTTAQVEEGGPRSRNGVEHTMNEQRDEAMSAASGASAAARRAEDRAREAAHAAQERARSLGDHAGPTPRDTGTAAGEAHSSDQSKTEELSAAAQSKMEEASAAAQSTVSRAYSSARGAGEQAYSGARSAGERAYSSARSAGEHASERLQASGEAVYRRGSEVAHRSASRASETMAAVGTTLKERPFIAAAILAGIGAFVGALLPPTRREDTLMGEQSDAVKAKAADTAEHEAERVRDVAAAAVDGARREAEARGLTPGAMKEAAKEEIQRVTEAGSEVARAAVREGKAAAKKGDTSQGEDKRSEDKSREDNRDETGKREPESNAATVYPRMQAAPVVPSPAVPPVPLDENPEATSPEGEFDPLKRDK